MEKDKILGIDIGGTYLKYVLKKDGKFIKNKEFIADIKEDKGKFLDRITGVIKKLSPNKVGIAIAGLYDKKNDILTASPNIKSLENIQIKKLIEQKTEIETYIENDANASALGEYIYGAGKGSKILICLTLGTGLGGGVVINGELLSGVNGCAMEIGHTVIKTDGWLCHCGRKGCLEAYVSSYGLERIYFLKTGLCKSSFEIINLANKDNKEAKESITELSNFLSVGITNLIHIFNPDRIILSGGIVESYSYLTELVKNKLNDLAFPLPLKNLKIGESSLGEYSGAFGALALAEKLY